MKLLDGSRDGLGASDGARRTVLNFVAITMLLGLVAAAAPEPASSDRQVYESLGRHVVLPDCADGHCFRPLVAGVLEHVPGPSPVKWKVYAVLVNALAAIAVGRLCLVLGLSTRAGVLASWLYALGSGSLYSVYDTYTSDALMYLVGPIMVIQLLQGRRGRATLMASVAVLAKEFAAAPLWMFTLTAALQRRWPIVFRLLACSTAVMLVWFALQTFLIAVYNYRYGGSASADLLGGGYIAVWLKNVGFAGAVMYVFTTFGALYPLALAALPRAGRDLRLLALSALPVAAVFLYVQQPERALWNFHFVVIPLAVMVLEQVSSALSWAFIATFGLANLRIGGQLRFVPASRFPLLLSLLLAIVVIVRVVRQGSVFARQPERPAGVIAFSSRRLVVVLACEAAVCLGLTGVRVDVNVHRNVEGSGINQWGYRGRARYAKAPGEFRIAVVGGSAVFAADTAFSQTIPVQLANIVNELQGWTTSPGPFVSVSNLAEPAAGAASYVATLRDYTYLDADLVCIYDGYDVLVGGIPPRGRRRSLVFRTIGYLPMVPAIALGRPAWLSDPDGGIAPPLRGGSVGADDASCTSAWGSYCSAMADTVRFALAQGRAVMAVTPPYVSSRHELLQRSLASELTREFDADSRFSYVNLGHAIDVHEPAHAVDGIHPTGLGSRLIAAQLADRVVGIVRAAAASHTR